MTQSGLTRFSFCSPVMVIEEKNNKSRQLECAMNWDAIAATAEVIGVVGLIVSIGYLGLQTRQGNRVAEDVAFQGVFSLALEQNRAMVEGDNRDVIIKGLLNYDEMVGSERFTFDTMMLNFITVIEPAKLVKNPAIHGSLFCSRQFFFGKYNSFPDIAGNFPGELQL